MTYGRLKSATKLFLIGDNQLPEDADQMSAAVEMAYLQLSGQATALKLLTTDSASQIIRQGPGGTYIRMPELPTKDTDELDIDKELAPAVARLIASYISRDRSQYHESEARKVVRMYESKVRVFIEEQESEGRYIDVE